MFFAFLLLAAVLLGSMEHDSNDSENLDHIYAALEMVDSVDRQPKPMRQLARHRSDGTSVFLHLVSQAVTKEHYTQRGELLCEHMRVCKKLRSEHPKAVAPHVHERIRIYNEDCAVRPEELIDLEQVRKMRLKGRGAYKKWSPTRLL